jgi:4a-hydroxytetrahydrobiopterin dehydratase
VPRLLQPDEIDTQLADLPGWSGDTAGIRREYTFPDFPTAVGAVDAVAEEAEDMDHHPDIDIRWRSVTFGVSTHSAGGVTQLDVELAHRIHRIATERAGE